MLSALMNPSPATDVLSAPRDGEKVRADGRVLIFVVSYEASRHIGPTLDRIPKSVLDDTRVDILVIDDASKDTTASDAREWATRTGFGRLTVLRNPVNQGYGGNQKLGYRLALD